MRSGASEDFLLQLIYGRVSDAASIEFDAFVSERIAATGAVFRDGFDAGAKSATKDSGQRTKIVGEKPIYFTYDPNSESANRFIANHGASLVRDISRETRTAIRDVLVESNRAGAHPLTTARELRDYVGLTSRQAVAAYNYREKQIENGIGYEKANARTKRYSEKLLRRRARTIARTEASFAVNAGRKEVWNQLVGGGFVSADAGRIWLTAEDERVCPICGPLNNARASIDGAWRTDDGSIESPPAHPNCRCTTVLEV